MIIIISITRFNDFHWILIEKYSGRNGESEGQGVMVTFGCQLSYQHLVIHSEPAMHLGQWMYTYVTVSERLSWRVAATLEVHV